MVTMPLPPSDYPLDTQLSLHGCTALRAKHATGTGEAWLDITAIDGKGHEQSVQFFFPPRFRGATGEDCPIH